MGIRLNGISALSAVHTISEVTRRIDRSVTRLASGERSFRDDPAGLSVAEQFRAQVRSLGQAQGNISQGVSLTQVAESGLGEVSDILARMRELAVQSSNGTLTSSQRANVSTEFGELQSEITRIANTTSFNGLNPLNDSGLQVGIQVGADAGDTIGVNGVNATAATLGVASLSVATSGAASSSISTLDTAIQQVASLRATFGTAERRLEGASRLVSSQIEASSAAESRIRDTDFALEVANLTRDQVIQQAGIAALAQANASQTILLRLLTV